MLYQLSSSLQAVACTCLLDLTIQFMVRFLCFSVVRLFIYLYVNCLFRFLIILFIYRIFDFLDVKQSSRSDSLLSVYDNVILRANSQPI